MAGDFFVAGRLVGADFFAAGRVAGADFFAAGRFAGIDVVLYLLYKIMPHMHAKTAAITEIIQSRTLPA